MRVHLTKATLMARKDDHQWQYRVDRMEESGAHRFYLASWPMNVQLPAPRAFPSESRSDHGYFKHGPFQPDSLNDLESAKSLPVYCLLLYSLLCNWQGSDLAGLTVTKGLALMKQSGDTYKRIGMLNMTDIYYEKDESNEMMDISIV